MDILSKDPPVKALKKLNSSPIFWLNQLVDTMIERGIVKNPKDGVKILGNGEVTKKLTVKANAFSASAKEKIEAVGGTA